MQIKGFENKTSTIETPNDSGNIEKPFENSAKDNPRVDINVLKSKLREKENTVLKKKYNYSCWLFSFNNCSRNKCYLSLVRF